jgi:hypothetical protein
MKISQEIREQFAPEVASGLEEKAQEFVQIGGEVYR